MANKEAETGSAELDVTTEEACRIASMQRYVISLNATVGLVSPTERRIATPTYRAVELAALILEDKTLEETTREAKAAWTGSLSKEHHRALELVRSTQDVLHSTMAGRLGPEQLV